jgi:hypothetical protein
MSAIKITHQDLSVSQLRAAAARTVDAKKARRILAIAIGLDGHARRAIAPEDRKFLWPAGPRPAGQPGLSEPSL